MAVQMDYLSFIIFGIIFTIFGGVLLFLEVDILRYYDILKPKHFVDNITLKGWGYIILALIINAFIVYFLVQFISFIGIFDHKDHFPILFMPM